MVEIQEVHEDGGEWTGKVFYKIHLTTTKDILPNDAVKKRILKKGR